MTTKSTGWEYQARPPATTPDPYYRSDRPYGWEGVSQREAQYLAVDHGYEIRRRRPSSWQQLSAEQADRLSSESALAEDAEDAEDGTRVIVVKVPAQATESEFDELFDAVAKTTYGLFEGRPGNWDPFVYVPHGDV